uniref:Uncharacterized protein n=1 Tax=Arundo donax TaxID=35708 RepID=A0A0A9QGV2_ARUDO
MDQSSNSEIGSAAQGRIDPVMQGLCCLKGKGIEEEPRSTKHRKKLLYL